MLFTRYLESGTPLTHHPCYCTTPRLYQPPPSRHHHRHYLRHHTLTIIHTYTTINMISNSTTTAPRSHRRVCVETPRMRANIHNISTSNLPICNMSKKVTTITPTRSRDRVPHLSLALSRPISPFRENACSSSFSRSFHHRQYSSLTIHSFMHSFIARRWFLRSFWRRCHRYS